MIFKSPEQLVEFFNALDLDKSTLVFNEKKKDCACGGEGPCQCPTVTEETKETCIDEAEKTCACQQPETVNEDEAADKFMKEDDEVSLREFINGPVTDDSIILESFSDSPKVKMQLSETAEHNTFYVKDYEAIENACGTGRVELSDRTSYLNMCEQDSVATVNLNIVIEGKRFHNVSFVLARTENNPYLVLNKDHFKS